MKDKLDKATLRLKLRKLYDDSPEEFEQIVEQLQGMAVADATMGPDPNGIRPWSERLTIWTGCSRRLKL